MTQYQAVPAVLRMTAGPITVSNQAMRIGCKQADVADNILAFNRSLKCVWWSELPDEINVFIVQFIPFLSVLRVQNVVHDLR